MDILILGNGFDLAHKLPTKYSDFLEFCQRVWQIWNYHVSFGDQTEAFKKEYFNDWDTEEYIRSKIEEAFRGRKVKLGSNVKEGQKTYEVSSDNQVLTEIYNLLVNNIWYKYFEELYSDNLLRGENWIDFEYEIREIIQVIDYKAGSLKEEIMEVLGEVVESETGNNENFQIFQMILLNKDFMGYKGNLPFTVKDFREIAYYDLERLIRALELYLSEFINNIEIRDEDKIPEIEDMNPQYVLDFNYTNTYERTYNKEGKASVFHIHGEADSKRAPEDNNMVLGIDEYWPEKERDNHTNFTIFKKFAQRIQKHTGNENYIWLEEIEQTYRMIKKSPTLDNWGNQPVSHIYIFGHSLDITDKDILSDLIGNEATTVTVYCHDKGTEGELIANVIGLIGEKLLLERVNSIPTRFEFKIQKQK